MCIVLGILILALLAYIVYLYASYYRIEDNQELVVEAPVDDTTTGAAAVLATDTEYSAVTYKHRFRCLSAGLQLLHGRRYLLLGGEP